jgi:hypothetical protein
MASSLIPPIHGAKSPTLSTPSPPRRRFTRMPAPPHILPAEALIREDNSTGTTKLARISHQVSTAAADSGASAALRLFRLLDIVSTMPAGPTLRAPCSHTTLRRLATTPGEKCGLENFAMPGGAAIWLDSSVCSEAVPGEVIETQRLERRLGTSPEQSHAAVRGDPSDLINRSSSKAAHLRFPQ